MIHYVSTVILSRNGPPLQLVRLLKQQGPAFLCGKYNFPGGRREPGETNRQAAVREVTEETGLVLLEDQLEPLRHTLVPGDYEFEVFLALHDSPDLARTLTAEPIDVVSVEPLLAELLHHPEKFAPDFHSLLALALEARTAAQA